jgi:hypothetical protein
MRRHQVLLWTIAVGAIVGAGATRASGGMPWCPWGCCASGTKSAAALTNVSQTRDNTPSVFAKMTSSTRRLVSGTKNMFVSKQPAAKKKRTGTTATYSTQPKDEEPGFFRKLFTTEPPPPPKTVKEWMSLEQVHP